jgi:REP element-mobilizing transposase RayT
MRDYHIPLFPGGLYHILNRANGDDALFKQETNYHYFLEKYMQHISPIAQTLAWCLLPNHYHFLVRIKPVTILKERYALRKGREVQDENKLPEFITEQFANWQNAYAKAFNKMYERKGSLFMNYLRRVAIDGEHQLGNTVFYIHKNPVHHCFAKVIGDWRWTSYKEYMCDRWFMVDSKEVMDWFGTKENFDQFHQQPIERKQT